MVIWITTKIELFLVTFADIPSKLFYNFFIYFVNKQMDKQANAHHQRYHLLDGDYNYLDIWSQYLVSIMYSLFRMRLKMYVTQQFLI